MLGALLDLWLWESLSAEPRARDSRLKTEELAGSDGEGGRGRALCNLLRRSRIEETLRVTGSMLECRARDASEEKDKVAAVEM